MCKNVQAKQRQKGERKARTVRQKGMKVKKNIDRNKRYEEWYEEVNEEDLKKEREDKEENENKNGRGKKEGRKKLMNGRKKQ